MVAGRTPFGIAVLIAALALPGAALAAFPGSNPAESPRANTPNDPNFDRCEADDPDTSPPRCTSYWGEDFRLFGFSPDTAWKYSTGSPKTVVAVLDTGIRWQAPELVDQVHLNRAELPLPRHENGS